MKLIVGLGNPGVEFVGSRHNAGFMAIEQLAARLGLEFSRQKHSALVAEGFSADREKLMLMEPLTYMNESGRAVAEAVAYYKLQPSDILVLHDDMDLPVGQLRIRAQGSAAGQKGMTSIILALGTDQISRIKLGISHPQYGNVVDYVLHPFGAEEKELLTPILERAAAAAECWLQFGSDVAMNRYNIKNSTRKKAEQQAAEAAENADDTKD